MPFLIVRQDITAMDCDAIVNAANTSLLGGGGVDGAIHRAAGPELLAECRTLHGCPTGQAKITGAYRLPCRYVIHTPGPRWRGGGHGEEALLRSSYRTSLELAWDNGCRSVAFPLISSGIYGYPRAQALQVAVETIRSFLEDHELLVYLVIFDPGSFVLEGETYETLVRLLRRPRTDAAGRSAPHSAPSGPAAKSVCDEAAVCGSAAVETAPLERLVEQMDESFSQMLLRKIDEKHMTDAACYKRANIDRKLFSKIRSDVHYRPSKPTAVAFAVALELSPEETEELLRKAGFALSRSSKFDIIVDYFIRRGEYDVFVINEALFAFDQALLGSL